MPFKLNTKATPKKIHFIWVGGPIYPEYLKSIQGLAQVAKRDGYAINLWVDDENNYHKTARQQHINIPNLNIRDIRNELFSTQNDDPFYQGKDPDFIEEYKEIPGNISIKFQSYIERELVGFKNFAAAADLLRLEILRQEGGWYFDTDTYFSDINPPFSPKLLKSTANLTPEREINAYTESYNQYLKNIMQFNLTHLSVIPTPPIDIRQNYKIPCEETYENMRSEFKKCLLTIKTSEQFDTIKNPADVRFDNKEILDLGITVNSRASIRYSYDEADDEEYILKSAKVSLRLTNNDMIGAVENNYCIKAMILDAMSFYQQLDQHVIQNPKLDKENKIYRMDIKRHPNKLKNMCDYGYYNPVNRRDTTIEAAGPGVIARVIDNIWPMVMQSIEHSTTDPTSRSALYKKAIDSLFIEKCVDGGWQPARAAGLSVVSICDNTWLGKNKKLSSFDAESIAPPQSRLTQEFKYQLKQAKDEENQDVPKSPKPG